MYRRQSSVRAGAALSLLLLAGLAEGAAGSCLSYGHSCWGAHGKRSGSQVIVSPPAGIEGTIEASETIPEDTRWFLSKLIVPHYSTTGNYKLWRRLEAAKTLPMEERTAEDSDGVVTRSGIVSEDDDSPVFMPAAEIQEDISPETTGEVLLVTAPEEPSASRTPKKLRVYKIMNHGSARKMD